MFGVNACSVCEEITVTLGGQACGGVRFCEECLHGTLGWHQFGEQQREKIGRLFTAVRKLPKIQALLEDANRLSAEEKKALCIGEARNRCMWADMEEAARL